MANVCCGSINTLNNVSRFCKTPSRGSCHGRLITFLFSLPTKHLELVAISRAGNLRRINLAKPIDANRGCEPGGNRQCLANNDFCDNDKHTWEATEALVENPLESCSTRSTTRNPSELEAHMIDGQVVRVLQQFNLNAIKLWLWANSLAICLDLWFLQAHFNRKMLVTWQMPRPRPKRRRKI